MSADRFIFSDGSTFGSMLDALIYMKTRPDVTVVDGTGTDVTSRLRAILANHGYGAGQVSPS